MHYEITSTEISIFFEDPKREAFSKSTLSTIGLKLSEKDLDKICNLLYLQTKGKSPLTQRNVVRTFLRAFLSFLRIYALTLPTTSNDWQIFLLYFVQFFLTDHNYSKASALIRMRIWSIVVMGVFEFWQVEEFLPCDVHIPAMRQKKVLAEIADQRLLGESGNTAAPIAALPQKILVSVEFASSGADYLDEIERSCRERINVIKNVCLAHWEALTRDGETGTSLAETVSASWINMLANEEPDTDFVRGGALSPLADDAHPAGHIWGLAVARQLLLEGEGRECISMESLFASRFFAKKTFSRVGYNVLASLTAMPAEAFTQLTYREQFFRFLGILSILDASAACCLLTIEHPEFTPDSIKNARLLNARGKTYLLVTDNSKSSLFSIDKPRARERKMVALTEISQRLLENIIERTALVRNALKRSGDKAWRYLFLGFGKGGRIGPLDINTAYLNGRSDVRSLCRLYPALNAHGLNNSNFDYRRVRTTMGVLRWFETGSIQAMSRRLGNSNRVVLEHYLPAVLLRAWNTRIIRRFQNTLIILAAHNESYLLEVSDFFSISDLQHFIAQLLIEYPGNSSPLAKKIQKRLNNKCESSENQKTITYGDDLLNVKLSPTSLTYLYAFSDFAIDTLTFDELRKVDNHTKLSPSKFVDLARLIRHACENETITLPLSELLDLPRLRLMHQRACVELPQLRKQFEKFSFANKW
jgi:hypothetical protein